MNNDFLFEIAPSKLQATTTQIEPQPQPNFLNQTYTFGQFLAAQLAAGVLVYSVFRTFFKTAKNTPMLKIGLSMLEPFDIELQDELDNLAQSIRETAKADRAIVAFFHNGEYNSILHFKKFTIMAESYKKGLVPIKQDNQGKMISEFITQEDLAMYKVHRANEKFVEVTIDSPSFSVKRKAALLDVGVSRSLDRFLLDELNDKAFGFVSLQYYSMPYKDSWFTGIISPATTLPQHALEEIEHHITRLHNFIASKIKNTLSDRVKRIFTAIVKLVVSAAKGA